MTSLGALLKEHWMRQRINLRRGASETEIATFETKNDVRLPEDMREYFSVVNGFESGESDNEFITFYSLEEIERLNISDWGISHPAESYFIFADWSISAHAYAIQLLKSNTVANPVVVTYSKLVKVADSFSEFMQAYIKADYAILNPDVD